MIYGPLYAEAVQLQFGHGSDAVEICTRHSGRPAKRRWLQFGHGSDAVEIPAGGHLSSVNIRFNSATAVMPWKFNYPYAAGGDYPLQFGHGSDAVEMTRPARMPMISRPLQFGHGSDAVEMVLNSVCVEDTARFNSATAVMPWK